MILAATSTQLSGSSQNEIVSDCGVRTAGVGQFGDISDIKGFESEEEQEYNCVYNNNAEAHALAKLPPEIQLIKHVTREQALYNPKHEFYRNAARKDIKWAEIGAAIGWTELQCKAKWKAFRDQYCRELKRSKTNPKATVKWKYFKHLEFLRPFALSRNYRPRYVPNNNSNGTTLSTSTDEHKKPVGATTTATAAIIPSDYGLLQSIKMEPKTQQDDQQHEFVNECVTLTSTMNVSAATAAAAATATEQTVKNETIVVIAAEQFQHLNSVLQQQQQDQSQHQTQQPHHEENWSFLASTTDGSNNLLTNQQQLTTTYNHNHNSNNQQMDQASNSSADYALLRNAIADCVAAAEADASHLSHQSLHQQQQDLQTKAQQLYVKMFQPPSPATATTSSDEEDDDPIHKFLNIESYFEKELIAMVQSEDILYNNFHPNYRNAKRKLDVWADIARKMKKTVKQCRLKWKALRDQYIREHKRLRNRKNIENLSRWKHYDALNFLHNFIKHKSETDDKKTLQLKGEGVNNAESILQSHVKIEGQHQQQIQLLDLNPTLSGYSNALAEHQRKSQEQQPTQHHSYHEDIKSSISISSSATVATTTGAVNERTGTTAQPMVDMDENQSNSADEYDAIDIDNYINGDRNDNDVVMHENVADDDGDDEDDDGNERENTDGDVNDVLDNDNGGNEIGKSVENMQNYSHANVVANTMNGSVVDSTHNQVDSLQSSDFRELKNIVSRVNSPALVPMTNNQQQLRQQSVNNHQNQQHQRSQNESDHIMQVVSLSCDDVVVLNEAAQFGFVVASATASATGTTPTTTAATTLTSTKTSLAMQQRDFTEQLVKLNTTVSPTSTAALTSMNTTNANVYYNNSNSNNTQSGNTSSNSNNNNNISVGTAHDVGCVLSAIATCSDFGANFNNCATPAIATTSLPATYTTGTTSSSSASSCLNSSLTLSNATLPAPIATAMSTTTSTTNTTTAANGSMCTFSSLMNAIDDDEVGVFFKAIAMKIRSVNLSPIEFTDLQIEVLRVINQSLRKN